jgi:hypothetical protein
MHCSKLLIRWGDASWAHHLVVLNKLKGNVGLGFYLIERLYLDDA